MNKHHIFILLLPTLFLLALHPKAQDIAPQVWNNVYVGWKINDQFLLRNAVAYNVLVSKDYPWSEVNLSSTGVFKFKRIFEASAGLYYARTWQTESLSSNEIRPYIGFSVISNTKKRWSVSNFSKLEMRRMIYSDDDSNTSFRFRNRTYAAVSLSQPSLQAMNNLFLFGYFEAFFNFGEEVRERFFNQFKYKLGLGYRLSSRWSFSLGLIHQDATNNVINPSQLPTNLITNWIIDWGVAYSIGSKQKEKSK